LWPTPRAERAGRSVKLYVGTVSGASHARQANGGHGDLEEEVARRDPKAAAIGGPLNPTFVAWLMGYPLTWLKCAPSGMPSSRKSQPNS
jgi:hypothetical protein